MLTIYDKQGKAYHIPHDVDAKEALRSGNYFQKDPSKRKILPIPGKEVIAEKKPFIKKKGKIKDMVQPLFGNTDE